MKRQSFFPHFYRRISALFLFVFTAIIIVNLFSSFFSNLNEEQKTSRQLMVSPSNSQLHERLGRSYLEVNLEAARKEYLLAEEYYQQKINLESNIAGLQSPPWQSFLNLIGKRDKIKKDLVYWEKVTNNAPDYQYAKLKLAVLYAQLGMKEKGGDYLLQVLRDDPTSTLALSLKEKFK